MTRTPLGWIDLDSWLSIAPIVIPLVAMLALYGRGYRVLVRRAANKRARAFSASRAHSFKPSISKVRAISDSQLAIAAATPDTTRRHALLFASGWLVLAVSLLPPLHELSEKLFSVHMVQHELLMTIVAPLLVLSRPFPTFLFALPTSWRRGLQQLIRTAGVQSFWHILTKPVVGWIAYALTLWLWHVPALFQLSLTSDAWHAVQHVCFLFASMLFWQTMLLRKPRAKRGSGVLYLFTTAVHTSVLGALITFDSTLWYPLYASRAQAMGISPIHDQQWAGLIMWIPGSVPYLLGAVLLLVGWMRESGRRAWATGNTFDADRGAVPDAERQTGRGAERRTGSDAERKVGSDGERRTGSDAERRTGSDAERKAGSDAKQRTVAEGVGTAPNAGNVPGSHANAHEVSTSR